MVARDTGLRLFKNFFFAVNSTYLPLWDLHGLAVQWHMSSEQGVGYFCPALYSVLKAYKTFLDLK